MSEKIKNLVVEDEPAVATLMTFLLTRAGYDVETAFTGRRGLELASNPPPSGQFTRENVKSAGVCLGRYPDKRRVVNSFGKFLLRSAGGRWNISSNLALQLAKLANGLNPHRE
jgi:hypothetical protein